MSIPEPMGTLIDLAGHDNVVAVWDVPTTQRKLGEAQWVPILQEDRDNPEDEDEGNQVVLAWVPLDRSALLSPWTAVGAERTSVGVALGRARADPRIAPYLA